MTKTYNVNDEINSPRKKEKSEHEHEQFDGDDDETARRWQGEKNW